MNEKRYTDGLYDAREVSNFLLDEFDASEFVITNVKLQKILFFVQGWGLARRNTSLIRNHFEAWDYGPVVKVVYDSFKKHGRSVISSRAEYFNYFQSQDEVVSYDGIGAEDRAFIVSIARSYVSYTAGQLIDMTHEYGAPWEVVRIKFDDGQKRYGHRIPNQLIGEYFKSLLQPRGIVQ